MKITVEHYTETITLEVPEEATAADFANLMYRLSLMVGYNEKNAADAFAELGETFETNFSSELLHTAAKKSKGIDPTLDW
jgi:hypothetical protein